MGTPEFAVESLKAITESQHEVVAVVTVPDKPSGRGLKLVSSPVKQFAETHGFPVFQPEKLRDDTFVAQMQALAPDVMVVVAFRMLPKVIWQIPRIGTFNLHASLLPSYRGAAPINWAIINGETQTGVTTFLIDEKIDTGAILLQARTDIHPRETAGTLHDKLMLQGSQWVVRTLDMLAAGNYHPKVQAAKEPQPGAPKLFKENCRIDWAQPGMNIERLVRGLSPYPTAWTELLRDGQPTPIKIYDALFHADTPTHAIGTPIVKERKLYIAVNDGYIEILELQIPGKKRMKTNDLLNGFAFTPGDYVV